MISGLKHPTNPPIRKTLPLLTKVLAVINPAAGSFRKRKKLKPILRHLQLSASGLEIFYTAGAGDATRLVREKKKEGWSLILCAGGDGTINEVINGMMQDGTQGGTQDGTLHVLHAQEGEGDLPPLAILPTGTGNGLAREIGLPLNPWKAYTALLEGAARPIHLGRVHQRYFVLMGGVGFDAYVTDRVERRGGIFKKLPKLGVYLFSGLMALFSYRYPMIRFFVNGASYEGTTGIVAKARLIAGPFVFAPRAEIDSPSLILCLMKSRGPWGYLWTLANLFFLGRAGKGIEYVEGKRIEVAPAPAFIQADGEMVGAPPALFTVSERPLYLIYPSPKRRA